MPIARLRRQHAVGAIRPDSATVARFQSIGLDCVVADPIVSHWVVSST
jgi:hypothetical protein